MNPTISQLRSKFGYLLGNAHKIDNKIMNTLTDDLLTALQQAVEETSDTKTFPTALTESDINKIVSINSAGEAVLYQANEVDILGAWNVTVSDLPAIPGSTVVATITNGAGVQQNITHDNVMNEPFFTPPVDAEQYLANLMVYIINTYNPKYTSDWFGGTNCNLTEVTSGTVAATFTGEIPEIVVVETVASNPGFSYDTVPVDGTLVGIDSNGQAVVDISNIVMVKLSATIAAGSSVMATKYGTVRELVQADGTESTYLAGRTLVGGIVNDVVPMLVLNSPYSSIVTLQAGLLELGTSNYANTIFIDPTYGEDLTGEKGNFGKPFNTLFAAISSFTPGDLIWMRPGTHSVNIQILVDGLNMWCDPGCNILSGNQFLNADTTAGGTTLTLPVNIRGYATLNDADGGGGGFLTVRTNPDADFNLEFDEVIVANISNAMVLRDGLTKLKIRKDFTCGGRPFRLQDTANLQAEIGGNVTCTFGSVFNSIVYSDGMSWSGTASIKAKTFIMENAVNGQHYCRFTGGGGGKISIELDSLVDDASGFTTPFMQLANGFEVTLSIKKTDMIVRPLYAITSSGSLILKDTKGTFEGCTQDTGFAQWENVHLGLVGTTVSCINSSIIRMFNSTIDSSAFSLSNITLDATSTAKLRDVLLVLDGVGNSVVNPAGSVLTCMDVFASHAFSVPAGAVGQYYINAAFTV